MPPIPVDTGFRVAYQYGTVESLGASEAQKVQVVGYVTKDHGIPFEARIPLAILSLGTIKAVGLSYTSIYETVAALPGVSGVEWSQGEGAGGLLIDLVVITVSSDSGNSSASLTVPLTALGAGLHKAQIEALQKTLNDAEAL